MEGFHCSVDCWVDLSAVGWDLNWRICVSCWIGVGG